MQKAVVFVLFAVATAVCVVGCRKGEEKEVQPTVSEQTSPPSALTDEVTPVEATTTQGSKVAFPGGEISWADAVVSFAPGDPAIFEIGPEVEPILVAISEEGENWIDVGRVEGSTCDLDIEAFAKPGQRFRFVKLTDAEAGKSNESDWPGADVDAVGAINTLPTPPAEGAK